jgi:hypothetical protein
VIFQLHVSCPHKKGIACWGDGAEPKPPKRERRTANRTLRNTVRTSDRKKKLNNVGQEQLKQTVIWVFV